MKKATRLLVLILLVLSMTACSGTNEIKISEFFSDDGELFFPGLKWAMTLTELEEALGYKLGRPVVGDNMLVDDYYNYISFTRIVFMKDLNSCDAFMLGSYGQTQYEFYLGKLEEVRVRFLVREEFKQEQKSDLAALAKYLPAALIELLGEDYAYTQTTRDEFHNNYVKQLADDNVKPEIVNYSWQPATPEGIYVSLKIGCETSGEKVTSVILAIGKNITAE